MESMLLDRCASNITWMYVGFAETYQFLRINLYPVSSFAADKQGELYIKYYKIQQGWQDWQKVWYSLMIQNCSRRYICQASRDDVVKGWFWFVKPQHLAVGPLGLLTKKTWKFMEDQRSCSRKIPWAACSVSMTWRTYITQHTLIDHHGHHYNIYNPARQPLKSTRDLEKG